MKFNIKDLYQTGGYVEAKTVSQQRTGLKDKRYNSMMFPGNGGNNAMTMDGMTDAVKYYGLDKDGNVVDQGIAKPGQGQFNVYGDKVLEQRIDLHLPEYKEKKKPVFSPKGSVKFDKVKKELQGAGIGGTYRPDPNTEISFDGKARFDKPEKSSIKATLKKTFQGGAYSDDDDDDDDNGLTTLNLKNSSYGLPSQSNYRRTTLDASIRDVQDSTQSFIDDVDAKVKAHSDRGTERRGKIEKDLKSIKGPTKYQKGGYGDPDYLGQAGMAEINAIKNQQQVAQDAQDLGSLTSMQSVFNNADTDKDVVGGIQSAFNNSYTDQDKSDVDGLMAAFNATKSTDNPSNGSPSSNVPSKQVPGRFQPDRRGMFGLDRGSSMQLAGEFMPALYNLGQSFMPAKREKAINNDNRYKTLNQLRSQKFEPDYRRVDSAFNATQQALGNSSSNPAAIRANRLAAYNNQSKQYGELALKEAQAKQNMSNKATIFENQIGAEEAQEKKRITAINNQNELSRQGLQDKAMTQVGTGMVDLGKHLANYDMNQFEWETMSKMYNNYGLVAFEDILSGKTSPRDMIRFMKEDPEEFERLMAEMNKTKTK